MDHDRITLALAEMMDVGYSHEWIGYLMDIYGVPKNYARPVPRKGQGKYMFCKELFRNLAQNEETRHIVLSIASYVVETERFDKQREADAMKYLPTFKDILQKAGFSVRIHSCLRVTPIFHTLDFRPDSTLCFVLMPFTPDWADRVYRRVVAPVLRECDLNPKRADDFFGADVIEDIWTAVNTASVVVADVTGRNPNVFYELGIAHTLGKTTVIITQNEDDVPFDIRTRRFIKYDDNLDGYDVLREKLPLFVKPEHPHATLSEREKLG